jgi:hypothetical protein
VAVPAGKDKAIAQSMEKVLGLKQRGVAVMSLKDVMIPLPQTA